MIERHFFGLFTKDTMEPFCAESAGDSFMGIATLTNLCLPALILAQEASQHFFFPEPVLLIPYRQIHPGFLIDYASLMCEAFKSFFSMIASHAAFSDTAERHLAGGEVDDGIVDAAAAKMAFGKDFLFGSRIFGEKIECKRVGMGFDLLDCIIQVRIGKYRKNRSENFFAHDWIVPGDIF